MGCFQPAPCSIELLRKFLGCIPNPDCTQGSAPLDRVEGIPMGSATQHPRAATGLRLAFSPQVWRGSLRIALVVGILLNLVNQGEAILHGFTGLDVPRFLLNFAVPYLVATYSAVRTALGTEGTRS